jgi:hypothetical protein
MYASRDAVGMLSARVHSFLGRRYDLLRIALSDRGLRSSQACECILLINQHIPDQHSYPLADLHGCFSVLAQAFHEYDDSARVQTLVFRMHHEESP